MKKQILVALTIFLLITGVYVGIKVIPGRNRPNIVLIIIDTLRADKLGLYGFPGATSPEIDAIGREGVVFNRAISQSSWTRPSIGSMLTSLYSRQLGIYDEKTDVLPEHVTTVAEALKNDGYYTLGITANPSINKYFQFDQGFDKYIDSDVIFPWMEPEEGKKKATRRLRLKTAEHIFKTALDEISQLRGKPTYLQINIMDVHGGRRTKAASADEDLRGFSDAGYLQKVREASRAVGHFVDALKQQPGWQNTLVVITSDHGEGLSDHPSVRNSETHGFILYQSQVWVPLILYSTSASFPRNVRINDAVPLLDLMPTLLDVAQAEGQPSSMIGHSLMPRMRASEMRDGDIFTATKRGNADKIAILRGDLIFINNHDKWENVPPKELQRWGERQDGTLTDKSKDFPSEFESMDASLTAFEESHPLAEPSTANKPLSPEDVERLRSLGYLN